MSTSANEPGTQPPPKRSELEDMEIELPSFSDLKEGLGRFVRKSRADETQKRDIKKSADTAKEPTFSRTFSQDYQSLEDAEDSMETLIQDYNDDTHPRAAGKLAAGPSFFGIFGRKLEKNIPLYDAKVHGPLTDVVLPNHYQARREYWVRDGATKVVIAYNKKTMLDEYLVFEPTLSEFEHELLERLYVDLRDVLLLSDEEIVVDKKQLIMNKTFELIRSYDISVSKKSLFKIEYFLSRNYLHWGRLTPIMEDPYVEDISCDGNDIPIFLFHIVETNIKTNIYFKEDVLLSLAIKLSQRTGKHISTASPIIDSTLPDGSRLNLTFGKEVTSKGTSFTIRKFKETPLTPIDLLNSGTFNVRQLVYFWLAVEHNKSVVFIGGTASGKTTSLTAISTFIPPLRKIITIEDTREIVLYHENWIASVTRDTVSDADTGIGMFALLKAALRQRPEYILVGEVRGEEAQILFQAMNTGHTSFSTMHAGGVDAAIYRLENAPLNVPRNMLQSLDIISIQKQVEINGKHARRSEEIVEIAGIDPSTGNVLVNSVFEYDPVADVSRFSGRSHVLSSIGKVQGLTAEQVNEIVREREKVLLAMQKQKITTYAHVAKIVYVYYVNPKLVMKNIDNLSIFLT